MTVAELTERVFAAPEERELRLTREEMESLCADIHARGLLPYPAPDQPDQFMGRRIVVIP